MRKISAAYINEIFTAARAWIGSKRFSIYLSCVGISTLIWFLMKFSGSFTSQLPVHVHFTTPSEEWYVQNEETDLMVDVQGFGFSLLWRRISGLSEIEVNLSNFEIKGDEDFPFIIVSTEYLLNKVENLFHEEETIKGLFPNIIKVDLSRVVSKTVPVHSRIYLHTENGFKLKRNIQIEPMEITLVGPEYVLSKITAVNTIIDSIKNLSEDIDRTFPLDVDTLLNWVGDIKSVVFKADVDELTSGSVVVQIEARVEDAQSKIKVLPTKVTVFYQVGLDDYALVNKELFTAYVSLPSSGELPEKLKVNIADIPDYVEVTRIEPSRVEYLLSKSNK